MFYMVDNNIMNLLKKDFIKSHLTSRVFVSSSSIIHSVNVLNECRKIEKYKSNTKWTESKTSILPMFITHEPDVLFACCIIINSGSDDALFLLEEA